ncbi:hypothetical protein [Pseudophaeobacter sp.]|uniref:COG3904 family protein n=1 Tax=Pseudophaeobacter sp. TaxID=1971739 RepID=UPI003299EE57
MPPEPFSLKASLLWHILLPRGAALALWWSANQLLQMPPRLVWGLMAADALLFLWASRAHLRSADAHMVSSGTMAPIWGGYLLLFLAILASLSLWWQALLIANRPPEGPSYAEQRALAHATRYSLTVSEDKTILIFDGEVTFGLTKTLRAQLLQQPDVTRVQLISPGGHIYEARGAAKIIQAKGLATEAIGLCASACTLIFAAGEARQLGPQGQLGFHGYALDYFGGLPQIDLTAEQEKDRRFLLTQGIHPEFIDRIFATPATELWHPGPAALLAAGLLRDQP